MTEVYLVSACLVGLSTRYDGKSKPSREVMTFIAGRHWVPFCPEQLGGLPTPRTAADIVGGTGEDVLAGTARVINRDGVDVTRHFLRGAAQSLELAKKYHLAEIILKSRSPSCGLSPFHGVTAALLIREGYRVREF